MPASLAKELGFATIAAFDSGNVVHVAEAFREKYPEKAILIAGDDDRHLPTNPGRAKAELAAKKVGGLTVFRRLDSSPGGFIRGFIGAGRLLASMRGNCAAHRHKRSTRHLRPTAAESRSPA